MTKSTSATRYATHCALAFALSAAFAASAATPGAKPSPNTHTITVGGKTSTYANLNGPPVASDVTAAYQFRARVSTAPHCIRFSTEADNAFLDGTMDNEVKAKRLTQIGTEASAAGCLVP